MSINLNKKTLFIITGILVCLILAIVFGLHILWPALDPVTSDMVKLFSAGAGCGLFAGIWLGRLIERVVAKEEARHHK